MALLFLDSFDHYNNPWHKYDYVEGGVQIITTVPRTGPRHADFINSGPSVYKNFPNMGTAIVGMGWRSKNATYGTLTILTFYDLTGVQSYLRVNGTTHKLEYVRANGTVLGTGTVTIQPQSWVYLEVKVTFHSTAGSVEVRVNGTTDILATNVATQSTAGAYTNRIKWCGTDGQYVDDIYVADTEGTINNDFMGDVKVEAVVPNGAGSTTDFTPSTGSNWENVDDVPPDDDTTYNASATPGDIDTLALGSLVTTTGTVKGIQVTNRWRKDDAGSRSARRVIRVGTTDYEGDVVTLTDDYVSATDVIEQNPDTSAAWSIADVNALEAGYKVEA